MKTVIYIEDGTVQLVLTPESEFEKNALSSFQERPLAAKLFTGSFFDCRGGWVRQADYHSDSPYVKDTQSLMLRIDAEAEAEKSASHD